MVITLLGNRDSPTDALEEYCVWLGRGLQARGCPLRQVRLPWPERGWFSAIGWLWRQSSSWKGRWVLLQYTALSWSRHGFPLGFLGVLVALRRRRAVCAVVFHDAQPYGGRRLIDRVRGIVQCWVMRTAYRWTTRSILTVPLEKVPWLPLNADKAVFIPVGANVPEPRNDRGKRAEAESPQARTVAVFGITGGEHIPVEARVIAAAMSRASRRFPGLRLVLLGRHSDDARDAVRCALDGSGVRLSVLGLLPAEEVSRALAEADVFLFVRGPISTRRGSALAGIACGLPVVGYAGPETAFPITEAGVVLVPHGDQGGLCEALDRVLADDDLRRELRERSRRAQREYFSWNVIAAQYLQVLGAEAAHA